MGDLATKRRRPARPTEAECQTKIINVARRTGWLAHAERTSITQSGRYATAIQGDAGFPDLVLVHPRHRILVIVELKRHPNTVEPAQHIWINALGSHIPTRVWWVPEQLREIEAWLCNPTTVPIP